MLVFSNLSTDILKQYFKPGYKFVVKNLQYGELFSVTFNFRLCLLTNNIVRVVKSRRMRWAGHGARMGEDRGVHRVLVG